MDVLLVNLVVYILTSFFFLVRFRSINIYNVLWAGYTFTAIMAYYCVINGVYYNTDVELGYKVSIIPYIANYLFTYIVLYPFLKYDTNKIDWSVNKKKEKIVDTIITISTIAFAIYGILKAGDMVLAYQLGFNEIYEANHNDGINLLAHTNNLLALINDWGGSFYTVFRTLVIVLLILKLRRHKWKSTPLYILLSLCFLPSLFASISMANRGGLFFLFSDMLFLYLILHNYFSKKVKKWLLIAFSLLLSVMIINAVVISESRFVENGSKKETSFDATSRYFGEPMANLGDMYFEKVKNHPMGETFFPEFSNAPSFKSLGEFFDYWNKRTGVDIDYMGTLFGDCYIQFGVIGAFIYMFFLSSLWRSLFFKYRWNYIPLIMYYFNTFGIGGMFGYGFYDKRAHFFFLLLVLICLLAGGTTYKKKKNVYE